MTTVIALWMALGIATLGMAIYRKILAQHEDTNIHLEPGGGALAEGQTALAAKITAIDKWGKILTIVTIVLGLGIGGVYVYEALRAVPL